MNQNRKVVARLHPLTAAIRAVLWELRLQDRINADAARYRTG